MAIEVYWDLSGDDKAELYRGYSSFQIARDYIKHIGSGGPSQYVAIIEFNGKVTRYLVTKGAGPLEVIPMEDEEKGWTEEKKMLSEVVNFVMSNHEMPLVPGEL